MAIEINPHYRSKPMLNTSMYHTHSKTYEIALTRTTTLSVYMPFGICISNDVKHYNRATFCIRRNGQGDTEIHVRKRRWWKLFIAVPSIKRTNNYPYCSQTLSVLQFYWLKCCARERLISYGIVQYNCIDASLGKEKQLQPSQLTFPSNSRRCVLPPLKTTLMANTPSSSTTFYHTELPQ